MKKRTIKSQILIGNDNIICHIFNIIIIKSIFKMFLLIGQYEISKKLQNIEKQDKNIEKNKKNNEKINKIRRTIKKRKIGTD